MSWHSKVIAQTGRQTDRQTDRQYENITFPQTRAVITMVNRLQLLSLVGPRFNNYCDQLQPVSVISNNYNSKYNCYCR